MKLKREKLNDVMCPFNYYFQMKFETLFGCGLLHTTIITVTANTIIAAATVRQLFDSKRIFAVQQFSTTWIPFDIGEHYCRIDGCDDDGDDDKHNRANRHRALIAYDVFK